MANNQTTVITAQSGSPSIVLPLPSAVEWELPTFVGFRLDGTPVWMGPSKATLTWELLPWANVDDLLRAYYDNTMSRRLWVLDTWNRFGLYVRYNNCRMVCPTFESRETYFCRGLRAQFLALRVTEAVP